MKTKKVYCYCRVSSGRQKTEMGGFGMSRQQNLLMQYINNYDDELKLGYTLDTSDVVFLNAEGVSGFSGKNIAPGSVLHGFIDDIVKGRIKNAVLVLENIDRFSRVNPNTATELFLKLINNGCDIHEAEQETVHHQLSDTNLISAGLTRSHKESLRKQKLSTKNWDKRFDNLIKNKEVHTARCPGWLKVLNGEYNIIEEHARAIRLIFELYNKGYGQAFIRDELNTRGWLYNGKTWGGWNIHRVLTDVRVTGKYRPQSKIRQEYDGMIIYPEIISQSEFKTAEQKLKSKGRSKTILRSANNLFSGMLMCGICNEAHLFVMIDYKNRYCRCSHVVAGNKRCSARGFKYEFLEVALLNHLRKLNDVIIAPVQNEEFDKINDELIYTINYRDEVRSDIDQEDIPDPSDRRILKNLQIKIRELENRLDDLKRNSNIKDEVNAIAQNITDRLLDRKNVAMRQEFNVHLRKVIKRIAAFRTNSDTILISIEYYSGKELQWLNVDAKDGQVIGNVYISEDEVTFLTKQGTVIYNQKNNTYIQGENIISKDEVLNLLPNDTL